MRPLISILLVALLTGAGYAKPVGCCDPGTRETKSGACHHVPARPTLCHHVQGIGCLDSVCEPKATLNTVGFGTRVLIIEFFGLPGYPTSFQTQSEEMAGIARLIAIDHASGKLFLRNRVLLI